MGSLLVPTVVENTHLGERAMDVFSRLLNSRIVFLHGPVDEATGALVVAQLLHLDAGGSKDINLYISSPGGDMTVLFAIYDTMQHLQADVATICVGQAASAAAVLLAAGTKGKRWTLPNARVLIHQPHGGAQGQSVDIEIAAREMAEMRNRMVAILADTTGQTRERIRADIDRDYILRGEAAVEYGIVDGVLPSRKALAAA